MATSGLVVEQAERMQFQALFPKVWHVEFTWNPVSVNSNGYASETITVPGVAVGDIAFITYEGDTQELLPQAHIHAADTVEVHLFNPTAGAVDLAAAQANLVILRTKHAHA